MHLIRASHDKRIHFIKVWVLGCARYLNSIWAQAAVMQTASNNCLARSDKFLSWKQTSAPESSSIRLTCHEGCKHLSGAVKVCLERCMKDTRNLYYRTTTHSRCSCLPVFRTLNIWCATKHRACAERPWHTVEAWLPLLSCSFPHTKQ